MPNEPTIRSDIAWSNAERIVVRGLDLPNEIIGKVNLGDMAYLELFGRLPSAQESAVFNALAVTLVEHGLTPSVLATRMTYLGAPESMQAAVAAGLCGLGMVFAGSMEEAAKVLQETLASASVDADLDALAAGIVADYRAKKRIIPGIGHNLHKAGDPRTPRLFEVARENGVSGRYVLLMQAIEREAEKATGRRLPVNATGAIAAVASEIGLPWIATRGLAVMARAIGLVAHILEEARSPMAKAIWDRCEATATSHIEK
ncbi:MAG: citryl-CoA lyase [Steroidobacteraceae bacterium]